MTGPGIDRRREKAPAGSGRMMALSGHSQLIFDGPHQESTALPAPKSDNSALKNFVSSSEGWSGQLVPLPRRLQLVVWLLVPAELFWDIWLATVVGGVKSCRDPICTVATLDHHAAALLACGVFCVAVLAGLMPCTRGFSRCNGIEVIGLVIAVAAGVVALLGIAALLIGAVIVLIVLATFLLALTATSRREIEDARPRTPFPIAPPGWANPFRAHRVERPD